MKLKWPSVETLLATKQLTLHELGRKMGYRAPHAVYRHKNMALQGRNLNPKTVGRYAKALGVPVRELIASEPGVEAAPGLDVSRETS